MNVQEPVRMINGPMSLPSPHRQRRRRNNEEYVESSDMSDINHYHHALTDGTTEHLRWTYSGEDEHNDDEDDDKIPPSAIALLTGYYCSDIKSGNLQSEGDSKKEKKEMKETKVKNAPLSRSRRREPDEQAIYERLRSMSNNNNTSWSSTSSSRYVESAHSSSRSNAKYNNQQEDDTSSRKSLPFMTYRTPDFGDIELDEDDLALLNKMMTAEIESQNVRKLLELEKRQHRQREKQLEKYREARLAGATGTISTYLGESERQRARMIKHHQRHESSKNLNSSSSRRSSLTNSSYVNPYHEISFEHDQANSSRRRSSLTNSNTYHSTIKSSSGSSSGIRPQSYDEIINRQHVRQHEIVTKSTIRRQRPSAYAHQDWNPPQEVSEYDPYYRSRDDVFKPDRVHTTKPLIKRTEKAAKPRKKKTGKKSSNATRRAEEAIAAAFDFFKVDEIDRDELVRTTKAEEDTILHKRIEANFDEEDCVSGVTTPTQLEIPVAIVTEKNDTKTSQQRSKSDRKIITTNNYDDDERRVRTGRKYGTKERDDYWHRDQKRSNNFANNLVDDMDDLTESISSTATSIDSLYYTRGGYLPPAVRKTDLHSSSENIILEEDEDKDDEDSMPDFGDNHRRLDEENFPRHNIVVTNHTNYDDQSNSQWHESWVTNETEEITYTKPYDERPFDMEPQADRNRQDEENDSLFVDEELARSLLQLLEKKKAKKSKGNKAKSDRGVEKKKQARQLRSGKLSPSASSTASPMSLQKRLDRRLSLQKIHAKKQQNNISETAIPQLEPAPVSVVIDTNFKSSEVDDDEDDNAGADDKFLMCCESVSDFESYKWINSPPDAMPFKTVRTSNCSVVSEITKAHFDYDDDNIDDHRSNEAEVHQLHREQQQQRLVNQDLHLYPPGSNSDHRTPNIVSSMSNGSKRGKRSKGNKTVRWSDDHEKFDIELSQNDHSPFLTVHEFPREIDESCRIIIILLKGGDFDMKDILTSSQQDGEKPSNFSPDFEFLHCDFQTQQRMKVIDILKQIPELQRHQRQQRRLQARHDSDQHSNSEHQKEAEMDGNENKEEIGKYSSLYILGSELINMLSLQDYFCMGSDESEYLLRDGLIFFAVPDNFTISNKDTLQDEAYPRLQRKRLKQQMNCASVLMRQQIREVLVSGRDLYHLKCTAELMLFSSLETSPQ